MRRTTSNQIFKIIVGIVLLIIFTLPPFLTGGAEAVNQAADIVIVGAGISGLSAALGANAVLIGRSYLFGLGVAGAEGVTQVVNILRKEFELAMALTGRPTLKSIDRSVIWPGRS